MHVSLKKENPPSSEEEDGIHQQKKYETCKNCST